VKYEIEVLKSRRNKGSIRENNLRRSIIPPRNSMGNVVYGLFVRKVYINQYLNGEKEAS
jgi:hypothetical protein